MPIQFGGPIGPLFDHVQQRQVPVDVFGTCDYRASGPPNPQMDAWIGVQVRGAIRNVIGQKFTAMTAGASTGTRSSSGATAGGWDSFSLSGVTANLPSTAIKADGNCTLTLVGCDITAPTAIEADGNANVTITGGSLNGSSYAVKADSLAKVKMTGTKVTGKTQANGLAKLTGP